MKGKVSIIKLVGINITIFLSLILGLEFTLRLGSFVKRSYITRIKHENKSKKYIPENIFHPGVGHGHPLRDYIEEPNTKDLINDELSSIELYKKDDVTRDTVNVLILGGSTSDPLSTRWSGFRGNWINHLFDKLSKDSNKNFLVTNAAVAGSTSSNELLRLLTKMHQSQYDKVISFNGINELYFSKYINMKKPTNVLASSMLLNSIDNHGVIKYSDKRFFLDISFKNIFKRLIFSSKIYNQLNNFRNKFSKKLNNKERNFLDLETKKDLSYAASKWKKNIIFMNVISNSQGAEYFVLLQPTLGLSEDYCNKEKSCFLNDKKYIKKIRYLYAELRNYCKDLPFCIDISKNKKLTTYDSFYTDPRHPNSNGNKLISEEIIHHIGKDLAKDYSK